MTNDALLQAWLMAERDAVQAELGVAQLGQAAAAPQVAALLGQANEKRAKADALFRDFYKRTGKPPAQPGD